VKLAQALSRVAADIDTAIRTAGRRREELQPGQRIAAC